MAGAHAWGIRAIEALQGWGSPALDLLFKGLTFLGSEQLYLLIFPFLFWSLDMRLGARLGVLFLLSGTLNLLLKDLFALPRPFELAPGINLVSASGYGLPSGHAQSAVVLWGSLARAYRRPWTPWAAACLILLVGLSRVYLGVHFPTDVLAGWAVGGACLAAAARLSRAGPPALRARFAWGLTAASAAAGGVLLLDSGEEVVSLVGAFWGFAAGVLCLRRFFSLDTAGTVSRRLLRVPVGLAPLLAIYLGLGAVFPGAGEPAYLPFRFLLYALVGAWVGLGAPLAFRAVGLAPGRQGLAD